METSTILYICLGAGVILFLIIAISIAQHSYSNFVEVYEKYDDGSTSSYITADRFAQIFNKDVIDGKMLIRRVEGKYTDNYEHVHSVLSISESTYDRASVSALAVVAHECGHAVQNFEGSNKIKRWVRLKKILKRLGFLIMPLTIIGIIGMIVLPDYFYYAVGVCGLGVALFFLALGAKIAILQVEKDASNKAIVLLEKLEILNGREMAGAKKVLKAAYMTYVGDFFRALLSWTFLVGKTKLY